MIITRLNGGLGNQMFQYATGKALAIRHNTDLKVDLSWFGNQYPGDTPRTYELDHFSTDIVLAKESDIPSLLPPSITQRLLRKWGLAQPGIRVLGENGQLYNSSIAQATDDTLLVGFWQTEQYFRQYADEIRKDFSFLPLLDKYNRQALENIQISQSVSLHVRRADYANNEQTKKFHGLTPIEYYKKSIAIIEEKIKKPVFFVFSDDIAWSRKHLSLPTNASFIDHNNGNQSFRDMQLMSRCKHHIIANSSFSWWGAWLNPNHDKIVIAPRVWFQDSTANDQDVVPKNWIKL
jgi:hypothetical protein